MDIGDVEIKLLGLISGEELTEEERTELESWIHASEENLRYYENLQLEYLRQRWSYRAQLIRRQDEKRYKKVAVRKILLRYVWSGAAAILILMMGIWYFSPEQTQRDVVLMEARNIKSLDGAIELRLSCGDIVPLGKENRLIEEKNQQQIAVEKEGSLNYRKTDTVQQVQQAEPIFNTLYVGRGGEYRIVLSDSSVVWLNSESELEYPVKFGDRRRVVKLRGEAYFQVKADHEHPFVVVSEGVEIMALGTEFNVNTHRKGWVETALVKGSVKVSKDDKEVMLQPAEMAVYRKDRRSLTVEKINPDICAAWRNGDIVFSDDRLEDIMDELALWYDFEIFYMKQDLKDILLSGDMKRYGKIEELLHFFERSAGLRFDIKGKTITVCER